MIIRCVIPKLWIKSGSFLTRAIAVSGLRTAAGLAAVHRPALHNKAASQTPLEPLCSLSTMTLSPR